jgi:hypothetical protein
LKVLEAKARDVHVLWLPRYFQQLQNAYALPDMIRTDPAGLAGVVNLFPLCRKPSIILYRKLYSLQCQLNSCLFGSGQLTTENFCFSGPFMSCPPADSRRSGGQSKDPACIAVKVISLLLLSLPEGHEYPRHLHAQAAGGSAGITGCDAATPGNRQARSRQFCNRGGMREELARS